MIIPETSKHFSEKRLGTHSTHIPHFLHTHPLEHTILPNNNKYYIIIFIIIEVKVRGERESRVSVKYMWNMCTMCTFS